MKNKKELHGQTILILNLALFANLFFNSAIALAADIPYTLEQWNNSRTVNLNLHTTCSTDDVGARCADVPSKTYAFCEPYNSGRECRYPKCGDIGGGINRTCPADYQCQSVKSPNSGETYNGCVPPPTLEPVVVKTQNQLLSDLNARKPLLEIKIPGLNFSDVILSRDAGGTYAYIAWLPEFISAIYKFGISIVSIVAVVIIIIQGIRVVTSGGGEAKANAYKRIIQSVVGLTIAWGSFAILYTINPNLVQFNALKVRVITSEEDLNIPVSGNEPSQEASGIEPSSLPPGEYDSLFQKYANCVGINWRILKMIARAESHFDPNLVNKAGFIGLFQTKPKNCVGKFVGKYAQYAEKCTVENLKNPSFNTAVGAMYQKDTLALIDTYCKDGSLTLQLAIFYSVLNSGYGGTKTMLQYAQSHGGCTENNVKEGSRIFWHDYKNGASAKWFVDYYPPSYCQQFSDPLDCMGIKKFNNVFKNAQKAVGEGITSVRAESAGVCPLDTNTPFPSS